MSTELIIGMAGSGGDGIVSAGESMINALALEGYHGILTKSFGPQIRGGESSCRLRLSTKPLLHAMGTLDIAVALNWEDFLKFGTELAKQAAGTEKAQNSVVLGLVSGWLGIAQESLLSGIRKKFTKKGEDVLQGNERAFAAGLEFATAHPLRVSRIMATPESKSSKFLVDGNDICAAAAIYAGCQFFGGYPITPSTEIMQYLNREIWKHGGSVLQAEDEIAGIGACVGASFAGKKALTATSGPGMSLKTEMLGLATIAELPLVCVNVQRGGPSTGIPTKSEQSDLYQAAFSAHGDVVRPVLAPISAGDTFGVTVEAFNIAEKYQTPVIILSDQEIAQRKETVEPFDPKDFKLVERMAPNQAELEHYVRFRYTDTGISPVSHPGMKGGNYLAAGIEHNEHGDPTAGGETHAKMNDKRIKKLDPLKRRRDLFLIEGDPDAPLALVSWGSMAGVVREALQAARGEGLKVKLLVPKLLYPVAEEIYRDFFRSVQGGLVVEQSHLGQLYRLIRMFVDVPKGLESLAKSGSNPIAPAEVATRLREVVQNLQRRLTPEAESQG